MGSEKMAWRRSARSHGDRSVRRAGGGRGSSWLLGAGGLFALLWFLIRVIPKPSRASYPCQRLAFPIASAFVVWLAGVVGSIALVRRARRWSSPARAALVIAVVAALAAGLWHAEEAVTQTTALAADLTPNAPVGVAKGIHPGRVVWVHDPDATNWDGPGNGYWWESRHTDQTVVDRMMDRAIRTLAGEERAADAWKRIFTYFNRTHDRGDRGYRPGEKIMIKVNYVGCIRAWDRRELTAIDQYDLKNRDYMNTSPQVIIALLGQLRDVAGVKEEDITVGDTLCYFATQFYEPCRTRFPRVRYLDCVGKFGRTRTTPSDVPLYWSTPNAANSKTDYVPAPYVEADYLINLANLKSHNDVAGVTLCGKNHYGSLGRTPSAPGYFDIHTDMPFRTPGMGHYRPVVDLMGHKHIGRKTVLFLIDGLYAGKHAKENSPRKWNTAPFHGDWTSSLFASQDPVAIDAVGFDLIRNEWDDAPHTPGTHDYLVEAALADKPPSGTFYDPDHDGDVERVPSLGVFEHWNNPKDKQYSRNLGTGAGIELVQIKGSRG